MLIPPRTQEQSPFTVLRRNNFDLIRLFAALSVVASHMAQHGIVTSQILISFIDTAWHAFPGVPIFFIVSGFLITGSWLTRHGWKPYLKARALRILPALFFSTITTTALLWWFGYTQDVGFEKMAFWFVKQCTGVLVSSTPAALKGFSGDMPNASIWTLPVEIEFYLLVPLLLLVFIKNRFIGFFLIAVLMLFSALLVTFDSFHLYKLIKHPDIRITLFQHFLWFGLGVSARLWWPRVKPLFEGQFVYWCMTHLALFVALPKTAVAPLAFTLAAVVLSAAFTRPQMAYKILKGNDISYGTYLYHRPFIHASVALGMIGWVGAGVVAGVTAVAAILSWRLVEKPALRLK